MQTSKQVKAITTSPVPELCQKRVFVRCVSCRFQFVWSRLIMCIAAVRSPSYPSMSAYLPALVSTSSILSEAASPSPSPSKTTETNEREMLVWQKSKVRRRRSYGDEPRASAVGDQDPHHHTHPVIVSDIFNPS
jgi:hypothetical protein